MSLLLDDAGVAGFGPTAEMETAEWGRVLVSTSRACSWGRVGDEMTAAQTIARYAESEEVTDWCREFLEFLERFQHHLSTSANMLCRGSPLASDRRRE